jgi:hypothetical protein
LTVYEAKLREVPAWRTEEGDLIARRWALEPGEISETLRSPGSVSLSRGKRYLIEVDFGESGLITRAVCPRLADRWGLATILGLGVGGIVDWASGAIWQYADGHTIFLKYERDREQESFCYRRTPIAEDLDSLREGVFGPSLE